MGPRREGHVTRGPFPPPQPTRRRFFASAIFLPWCQSSRLQIRNKTTYLEQQAVKDHQEKHLSPFE